MNLFNFLQIQFCFSPFVSPMKITIKDLKVNMVWKIKK